MIRTLALLAVVLGSTARAQAVAYPPTPNDPLDLDGLSVDNLRAHELDAGVVWTHLVGNPDGGRVQVVTHGVALAPAALPTYCDATSGAYLTAIISDIRADGGIEVTPVWCDGQYLRGLADAIPFAAISEAAGSGLAAGERWLTLSAGPFSGELWWCTFDVRAGGNGAGSYTVLLKQGATTLCQSPAISCTATGILWDGDPRVGVGNGPCTSNKIQARPADAGIADYNVNATFSTGCSQNPRGRLLCWARRQAIQ